MQPHNKQPEPGEPPAPTAAPAESGKAWGTRLAESMARGLREATAGEAPPPTPAPK